MKFADLNGIKLTYEVSGEGEPIIFVHGFLANGTGPYYSRFKELLADTYRVYSIDLRSHGGSADVSDEVTLKQCGQDVVALATSLDLEEVLLVGHSMGGFISMAAAIEDPGRFRALALLTPAASKGQPIPEEYVADFMAARADSELMCQRFSGMFMKLPSEEHLKILRDAALCLPDAIAEQWLRREWSNYDLTDRLASIDVPVLSLIGARDVVVSPQVQYEDALRLQHAKVVSFTDEGHMLPVEKPELCVREIRRFFQDLV